MGRPPNRPPVIERVVPLARASFTHPTGSGDKSVVWGEYDKRIYWGMISGYPCVVVDAPGHPPICVPVDNVQEIVPQEAGK